MSGECHHKLGTEIIPIKRSPFYYNEATEVIEFYIEITSISLESTLLGELSRTRIFINDTGGYSRIHVYSDAC